MILLGFKRYRWKVMGLLLLLGGLFLPWSIAQDTVRRGPLQVMVNLSTEVNQQLKAHFKPGQDNSALFRRLVNQHLMPVIDTDGLAQAVVGRAHWSRATAVQKKAFILYFKQSIVRTYVNAFDQYKGHKIYFRRYEPVPGSRYAMIRSIVVLHNDQRFNINYIMVRINGQWKIHNINVDGVDMISMYKAQFAETLKQSGLSGVIKKLKKVVQHDGP